MGPPHNKAAQENGLPRRLDDNSESMVFRVLPKGACSTICQIMDITNHGEVFDGNIHDAKDGLHKWALEDSKNRITDNVQQHQSLAFTCAHNPYSWILSSFFDRNSGTQRNG